MNNPDKQHRKGSELFIVDNSDDDWKVLNYLHGWCQPAQSDLCIPQDPLVCTTPLIQNEQGAIEARYSGRTRY